MKRVELAFWALIGVSLLIISFLFCPPALLKLILDLNLGFWFIMTSGASFFLLGLALIFLTRKEKIEKRLRRFLLLTGASAAGFFLSFLLHNFIYAFFIYWFGAGFWERIGLGDEPFFFFLAIIFCPIGFLIGAVGSAFLLIKKRKRG